MKQPTRNLPAKFIAFANSATLIGCAATVAPQPLPLHAAFLPIQVQETRADDEAEIDADALQLTLDAAMIASGLERGLQGSGFTRVTNLEPQEASAIVIDTRAQERLWQQQAAALGADILVRTKVVYDPVVTGDINEKFWLNLPLFLIGGPFCYFIDDRSYESRAILQAEFFDLTDVHDVLNDETHLLEFPILCEFEGAAFDFIERAGSSVPSYALSFLIPAGLLARDTESVSGRMQSAAVDALVADLLRRIQLTRVEFLNNDLATFHILERESVVQRALDGSVSFAIPVKSNAGAGLRNFILSAGGRELLRDDLDSGADANGQVWIRGEELDVPPDAEHLRLRVVDSVGGRRSYTFRIADAGR